MTSETLARSLETLFLELIDGPPADAAYMLNREDRGLLWSLDQLTASAASSIPASGGASIAAHVDHLRYGLSLLNRWSAGDPDPWSDADWTASWTKVTVTADEWRTLRETLAREARLWLDALRTPRECDQIELNAALSSIAHLAYHLGAIRQIDRSIRGPAAH